MEDSETLKRKRPDGDHSEESRRKRYRPLQKNKKPKEKKSQEAKAEQKELQKTKKESRVSHETSQAIARRHPGKIAVGATIRDPSKQVWELKEPMGGRMLNIDPMFTPDEKHFIVVYNASIQIYTTADSLLVRRIPLPVPSPEATGSKASKKSHIVAAILSIVSPNTVWVATSDAVVLRVDWTTGSVERYLKGTTSFTDMALFTTSKRKAEYLVAVEHQPPGRKGTVGQSAITAYSTTDATLRTALQTHPEEMQYVRASSRGGYLIATAGRSLLIGELKSSKVQDIQDLKFKWYSFDTPDQITSLDLQETPREKKKKQQQEDHSTILDLALGTARGSIYVYEDIIANLNASSGGKSKTEFRAPRKRHWHFGAVRTVKWSRDGNYIISGGSEHVLVLWQNDTGKNEFLPNLAASIENVVVSPTGSSYGVHLDDNSAMVLSTAEMVPTAHVAGIQSFVITEGSAKDGNVLRAFHATERISRPLPAIVTNTDPSRILLSVGNGHRATLTDGSPSSCLIQTFDLSTFRGIGKSPLARTNLGTKGLTSRGFPVAEPTITHLSLSTNGKWLASIDEWEPRQRDMGRSTDHDKSHWKSWAKERREIYLKFWSVGYDSTKFELVTRINEAHFTNRSVAIFDLVSDPNTDRFITVGDDAIVRFWSPKVRQAERLAKAKDNRPSKYSWSCTGSICLGEAVGAHDEAAPLDASAQTGRSGALALSEDGSTLFVALGHADDMVVYIIDAESGEVRQTLQDVFTGEVQGMEILGRNLVLLTDSVVVYDIIADEICYGHQLAGNPAAVLPKPLLAVNHQSRTFAVAVGSKARPGASELAVFSPEHSEPLFADTFASGIVTLLPATGTSGFIAIDAAAQVWPVVETSEATPWTQPMADLQLEEGEKEEQAALLDLDDDEESDGGKEIEAGDMDVDMDDEADQVVIAPQKLTEIFDVAPAFAMPPIEDLFYQVAGLFSAPPLAAESAA